MIDSPAPKKHHLFRVPSKIRTKETISFLLDQQIGNQEGAKTTDIQTNSHTDRQTDNKLTNRRIDTKLMR